jgi:hypothetical protein
MGCGGRGVIRALCERDAHCSASSVTLEHTVRLREVSKVGLLTSIVVRQRHPDTTGMNETTGVQPWLPQRWIFSAWFAGSEATGAVVRCVHSLCGETALCP